VVSDVNLQATFIGNELTRIFTVPLSDPTVVHRLQKFGFANLSAADVGIALLPQGILAERD
jgi:hypothetical protein